MALAGMKIKRQEFPFNRESNGPTTRTGDSRGRASTGRIGPRLAPGGSIEGMYAAALRSISPTTTTSVSMRGSP
jgi:hypothetical protein